MDGVTTNDGADIKSSLITISNIDVSSNTNYTVFDIIYNNSSMKFLDIGTLVNTPPSSKTFSFNNLAFSSSTYTSEVSLLSLNGIKYDFDIQFTYQNLSFTDITFPIKGYLMQLNHQLPHNVTITDIEFSQIKNGIIWMSTPDSSDSTILTHVQVTNISADSVEQESRSFFLLEEQAQLIISEGTFTNMFTYADGAVIKGSASRTSVIIEHSTFTNNTAQNGGVFSVSDQSSIK